MSTRRKNQPLFKKKNQAGPVAKTLLLILLLIVLVVIGFLLGEPLLSLFEGEETPAVNPSHEQETTTPTEPEVTTTPTVIKEKVTTTAPPEPEIIKNGMLRISFANSTDFESDLDSAISYASDNNYQSLLIELVGEGRAYLQQKGKKYEVFDLKWEGIW